MPIPSVFTAGLGIAIVEAAPGVVVCAVQDRVHTLGGIPGGNAIGVVVPVPGSGRNENAICFLAVESDGCASGTGEVVIAIGLWALEASGGRLGQMIAATGLIIDDGDQASGPRTETVLSSSVSDSSSGQRCNISCSAVGAPFHLVEGAGIRTIQGTGSAMCCHAWRATRGVDITWSGGNKRDDACGNEAKRDVGG